MSDSPKQSELAQSGSAKFTLAASTVALVALFAWALQNQNLLFQQNPDLSQVAITEQSESDTALAENEPAVEPDEEPDVASEVESAEKDAETSTEDVAGKPDGQERDEDQQTVALASDKLEEKSEPSDTLKNSSETNRSEDAEVANANSATKAVIDKIVSEQAAAQTAANEPTIDATTDQNEKDDQQLAAERLAAAKVDNDQLAAESALAEKLAAEKAAVDKALAVKLAAEQEEAEQDDEQRLAELSVTPAMQDNAVEDKATVEQTDEQKSTEEKAAVDESSVNDDVSEQSEDQSANVDSGEQQTEPLSALPDQVNPSIDSIEDPNQAATNTESAFEKSRREDLAKLPDLGSQVRFITNDTETVGDSKQPMDRMFELLFLYSETTVTVEVATNEYPADDSNQLLSRLRALVIINYLIERGLDEERFRIQALGKEGLPNDSHEVTVSATVIDK